MSHYSPACLEWSTTEFLKVMRSNHRNMSMGVTTENHVITQTDLICPYFSAIPSLSLSSITHTTQKWTFLPVCLLCLLPGLMLDWKYDIKVVASWIVDPGHQSKDNMMQNKRNMILDEVLPTCVWWTTSFHYNSKEEITMLPLISIIHSNRIIKSHSRCVAHLVPSL